MDTKQKITITALLIMAAFIMAGCGSSNDAQKEEVVWPSPPEEPRIQYLKTYQDEDDFLSKFGLLTRSLTGTGAKVRLDKPFDLCSDGQGRLFVTDVSQGIIVFDEIEKKITVFGEKIPVPLGNPLGIACGNGKVFIGVAEVGQVVVVKPDGEFITTIGKPGMFPNPVDVAYDGGRGRVVIVDNKKHQVFLYSETGDSIMTIGVRGEGDGEFNYPQSAAVDSAGNIYVVDAFNFRVEEFNRDGKFLRTFGQQGNIYGTFARPKGIAIDRHQNIYVVDAVHQNFQIFNQNFELLLFVGRFSNKDNWGFQNPVGIDIDEHNTIYVADQLNQRVQVFQLVDGD